MKRRLVIDSLIVLSMLVLPRIVGIGYEAGRMAILSGVYAGVAVLALLSRLSSEGRSVLDTAAALVILSLAWLESFPAWGHSAEVGLYLLFGVVVLKAADLARIGAPARRPEPVTA